MQRNISVNDRHLSHIQAGTLDVVAELYGEFFKAIEGKLLEQADHASNNEQQWNLFALARNVKKQQESLSKRYNDHLLEGFVQFKLGKLGGKIRETEQDEMSTSLSLVADDELERNIAVSSLARRIETRNMEQLFALNHRFTMLNGGKKIADDGNPIGPHQFSDALGEMLEPLELDNVKLAIFCRIFEHSLMPKLTNFYEQTNQYLVDQGILPNLRYSISKTKDSSDSAAPEPQEEVARASQAQATQNQVSAPVSQQPASQQPQSNTAPGHIGSGALPDATLPSAQYQQQLMQAIGDLQGGQARVDTDYIDDESKMAAQLDSAFDMVSGVYMQPAELASVVKSVEKKAVSIENFDSDDVAPRTTEQYHMVAKQIQDNVTAEQTIHQKETQAIDLVGMIFEYMLSDEQLPDSVKAVLSYLHTPFLKVALIDPEFFAKAEHPARELLNLLAEAGHKWVNSDGASQFKIFPKIKSVVRRILLDAEQGIDLLRELLIEMREFNEKVSRKLEMLEQRAKAKAEGEERIKLVKRRVYGELKHRLNDHPSPAAVVVLLLHPWADYMIFTLLRFSEDSEQWKKSLQMADDILWSIENKETEADIVRQKRMANKLQVDIKQAIEEISFDSNKAKKLIHILHELQLKAIAHQEVGVALPEEQKKIEAEVRLDEFIVEEEQPATHEEKSMVDKLQHVEFGSWLEFLGADNNKKNRLKIAWYNPKTEHYMLVDSSGQNVAMRSSLSIARDLIANQARIVETNKRPFFERALESIVSRLKKIPANDDTAMKIA